MFILTDDQRWDTLWAMPNVRHMLADKGVTFSNMFVQNSMCCPSRASILTGKPSHSTGVWTNDPPYGGFSAFDDRSTIATWLESGGYRTGLVGKYLNGYRRAGENGYIPPGWDSWDALTADNSRYYDYHMLDNGRIRTYGTSPADYSTSVFTNEAVSFIRSSRSPFFLYLAYSAPHSKYIPAPGDEGAFRHLSPFDGPSFGERNVSDKPAYVRTHPRTKVWAERAEKTRGGQLRTLLAVDRGVGRLVDTLRRTGRLANTMIVFTSDNGFMWGEHRLLGKGTAYDESIRVPLVVRYDPLTAAHPRVDDHLVENLDFAPTFADLANVPSPGAQGMTLLELLARQGSAWRTRLLIEHMQEPTVRPIPSFCAVRTERWLFVQYDTGERELYRLQTDPGEMRSLVGRQAFRQAEQRLRAWTLAECHPRPPHWLTARIG